MNRLFLVLLLCLVGCGADSGTQVICGGGHCQGRRLFNNTNTFSTAIFSSPCEEIECQKVKITCSPKNGCDLYCEVEGCGVNCGYCEKEKIPKIDGCKISEDFYVCLIYDFGYCQYKVCGNTIYSRNYKCENDCTDKYVAEFRAIGGVEAVGYGLKYFLEENECGCPVVWEIDNGDFLRHKMKQSHLKEQEGDTQKTSYGREWDGTLMPGESMEFSLKIPINNEDSE